MGGGTKTVGGGSATGVANDFNSVMKQGLNNGTYGAAGQTSGFGATIDAMLKGRTGDPTGLNDYQSTLNQMQGMGRYTPDAMYASNSAPMNMQGFGSQANIGQFGAQSGDLSGIMSQIGSQANLGSLNGYTNNLTQAGGQLGQAAQGQYFQRTPTDINNSSYAQAVQQLLQQQDQRNVADLRARYGMTGGSQGTPAMQAESLYRSQAIPQMAAAMGQVNQGEQGLDLQAAGLNSQYSLGQSGNAIQALLGAGNLAGTGRGQDLQNQLGNREADIGAGNTSVANASQMNSANVAARGQDLQNFLGSRGLDLQQLGMDTQNNQFNAGQNNQMQQANANNGLQAQNLYQQLLGQTGNLALQGGALNMQNQNSNTQNIQQVLQMLMGGYQQANGLGTPQAQTVQQPGFLGQLGSAASGLGNLFGSMSGMGQSFGNIFGGGQGNMQMPQFGGLPPISQTPGNQMPSPNSPFNPPIYQPQMPQGLNYPMQQPFQFAR